MKNALFCSIASALLLASGAASASTITVGNATALPGAGNPTTPSPIQVVYDNTGSTADGVEFEITFDNTELAVTVAGQNGVTCSAAGGVITVIVADLGGTTIPSNNFCNLTFTTLAGAADGDVYPLAIQGILVADDGGAAVAPSPVNGAITIQAVQAPLTLSYNPAVPGPVNIPNGGNVAGQMGTPQQIAVTATGNSGAASLTGCVASAGFSVAPAALNFAAAGSQNLTVGCTIGAAVQAGTLTCSETDADSAGVQRQWTLSCAAGFVPPVVPTVTTVTPAPGSTTVLPSGQPGSVVSSVIDFSAAGGAGTGQATINCSATAPLSIVPNGNQNVVGAAQPVDVAVSCTLTDAEQLGGAVNCAITDAAGLRNETFNFTCPAGQAIVAPSQPAIIPTNSLWSKLSLIGLLAALGVLVVGLRRQH